MRLVRATPLLAVAFASACTISDSNESVTTQQAGTHNRLATNRLATNRLATNRLATNRLATNSLDSTKLTALAETAQILQTAEGRDVYSYIISCALAEGVTISAVVPGAADTTLADSNYTCTSGNCTFYGGLGLTPRWATHRLDNAGKGWMSACLYSRVNANDTAEAISLRGDNAGLAVSLDEAEIYSVEEGAFYGNFFNDMSEPIDWNACSGQGQASGEFGGLVLRDCAEQDPLNPGFTYCGFRYAGDCADFTPQFPSAYACGSYDDGTYSNCHSVPAFGKWRGAERYREVITSYVSP